ncbi:MAG: protein kinase [Myxococcales bacterium]|nr:protein kinase [Myxococcales bacterium]
MTDSPDLPPSSSLPTRFGRYVVQRRLATGGMGEVWIAQDEQLQRRVAIKLMHPSEEPSHAGLERFEREARMIARLQHSHVVQVYDFGRSDDGTPYIVMELLDGEDLRRLLERSRPMSLAAVVPLVVQAAKGLHAAHRAGIVHHDLKPANLFLARQGGEQSLKVLDFGIATMLQADAADGRSTWAGSPAYMSPEQLRGDPIDHRTDLWSLAVVAYEALAGVSPFTGAGLTELRARILRERPLPPSHHVEGLGPDVDAFFARALAKDPRARFSSALELAAAFSALEHPESGRPATLLVVDDEPDLEELFRQRFRRKVRDGRIELLFAQDGQAALELLAQRPDVDVVLTDLNMPRMDGLTLLERLGRAGPALRSVVLTAYGDMGNIRAAMNAGAFDFLTKPIDFADLDATIDKAYRDAQELRRALRSIEENDALRLFVDDALMERLLPLLRISSEVSGDTIDATIASIDVWGVGQRTEHEPAPAVFDLLNRCFDVIVPIINAWEGVVVRFVGDAVLAVFQGPEHLPRAASACFAARAALSELAHAAEVGPVGACIGIDSGPVLSGSVGSKTIKRLDYTVLGATVSRALALERRAERGQILVREELARQLESSFGSRAQPRPDPELGVIHDLERQLDAARPQPDGELTATIGMDDDDAQAP